MIGPKPNGTFFQHFTAFLGNLLTASYGFMFGITAPTLILYKSDKTPLSNGPLSDDSLAWITSYLCIGAIAGVVFFKHLSDYFGRRATLLIAGIAQNVGWFGVTFGYNLSHIYISRCMVGLSGGGALAILPIYLTEISKDLNSQRPHVITYLFQSLGIMSGYILCTYLDYTISSLVGLGVSVMFSLCFPFVQESPYHYVKKNDMVSLEKSLRYFRAIRDLDQRSDPEFMAEVKKFKDLRNDKEMEHLGHDSRALTCCETLRAFLACLVLVITSQFCGVFVILNYSSIIFEDIGSILPVDISSVILGIAVFVGALLTIFIAKIKSRKCAVGLCSLIVGLCLGALGYFLQRKQAGLNSPIMDWIPVVCLVVVVFLSSASIYPLAFIILAELFPFKRANILKTFLHVLYWTIGLLLVKFHFQIIAAIDIHIYFYIFAAACIFQFVFILIILPNRQEKNL